MALFIIANSGKVSYGIKQYLCDTIDDIPFEDNGEAIAAGSTVYVVDSKKTYMYNSKGQWVEIITEKSEKLSKLSDVNFSNLLDGQVVAYDETEDKWVNKDSSDRKIALGKLPAGETTVTIYSADLTVNSTVDVHTTIDGANYTSMRINNGNAVLTYPAQSSDMIVKLVFFNDNDPIIYDYELNDYVASSYVDTGIKLRSEANRTRDWEMLLDATVNDTDYIYRWSLEYATRTLLSIIHESNSSSVRWMFNNNTVSALANLTTIQLRILKEGQNLTFYDMEDTVLYSVAWDNTLDDSNTLVVGGTKSDSSRFQRGTINSFKFRWLN